jgi:hypothetical protein
VVVLSGNSVMQPFNQFFTEKEEKRRLDPKCWKGYRKAGTKLKDGTRVNKCIKVNEENTVSGALGSPAGGTSQFSGDTYAPGDTRIPYSIYGKRGVMSRGGLIKGRKKRKKK